MVLVRPAYSFLFLLLVAGDSIHLYTWRQYCLAFSHSFAKGTYSEYGQHKIGFVRPISTSCFYQPANRSPVCYLDSSQYHRTPGCNPVLTEFQPLIANPLYSTTDSSSILHQSYCNYCPTT